MESGPTGICAEMRAGGVSPKTQNSLTKRPKKDRRTWSPAAVGNEQMGGEYWREREEGVKPDPGGPPLWGGA